MKVCVVTTSFPHYKGHHFGTFIWKMCEALARQNVTVRVVCPAVSEKTDDTSFAPVSLYRFTYFFTKYLLLSGGAGFLPSLRSSFLSLFLLPLYILSFFFTTFYVSRGADVLHAQWSLAGFISVCVGKLRRIPVIVTLRGSDIHSVRQSHILRAFFCWMIRSSTVVTSNNQAMLDFVDHPEIHLVMNGVDSSFHPVKDKRAVRKKLGLPFNKHIVLFVGRLSSVKNPLLFLSLVSHYSQIYDDALFVVVGDGPLRNQLHHSSLLFVGTVPVDLMPLYFQSADVCVLTSYAEGMPNVVLEAFASGVPVLSTSVGGVPTILSQGVEGFLCADSQEFFSSLDRLLHDSRLRHTMAHHALKRAQKLGLTWESCAKNYITLYQKAIKMQRKK